MNKPQVKLVPNKEVKDVFLADFLSFDGKNLKLSFDARDFSKGESFDAILEEGNQLKFLKAELLSQDNSEFSFEVLSSRDLIKREYERVSAILEVFLSDFQAQTINISAGGMQIRSEQNLEANKIYDAQIKYDSKDISVKYEILRSRKDKNKFFISGRFVDIDKDDKAFIIQQNLKNKIFSLKSLPIKQEGGENV